MYEQKSLLPNETIEIRPPSQFNIRNKVLSSGVGALITSLIVTPFDVIKTRLQAQEKYFSAKKCFVYYNGLWDHICYCSEGAANNFKNHSADCIWYRRPGHFNGTLDAFLKIVKYEGITSLWSGLPPTLVMALPATVLYFTAYDQLQEYVCKRLKTTYPPLWVPCIAGAFARTLTVTAVSPIELIRTKMQAENISYADLSNAISKLVKHKGYIALWHGWGPTMLRDVPFSVIYWSLYESIKKYSEVPEPSIFFSLMAGASAGSVAAILTFPFDVAKTHRQVELGEIDILKSKRISTKEILIHLYKKRGIKVLYSGLSPRLIKIAPSCAIMISTYEYGKRYFSKD